MFDLAETLVEFLGRDSARKLVKFKTNEQILERFRLLQTKDQTTQLTGDERNELMFYFIAENFVATLQRKARAMLRRPIGAKSPRLGGQG